MRLAAMLVVALCLVVTIIGALTAYVPPLDAEGIEGLHLNAPSGVRSDLYDVETMRPMPLARQGEELSSEVIAQLRAQDEARVRVREFALGRWTGLWMFAIGCAGLLAAGLFLRLQAKAAPAVSAFGTGAPAADPAALLEQMRQEVHATLRALTPGPGRGVEVVATLTILDRVGELQKTLMPAFIAARPRLVAAGGLAAYAQLMDSYAAAERAINRAWSAAADDEEAEAVASLQRGLALLEETATRLPGQAAFEAKAGS